MTRFFDYFIKVSLMLTFSIPLNFSTTFSLAKPKEAIPDYDLLILIDRNPMVQSLKVFEQGKTLPILEGKVSTGRETFDIPTNFNRTPYCSQTPVGEFKVEKLRELHLSNSWLKKDESGEYNEGVSMPHAIFFKEGLAIHAANGDAISKLGKKASGGCIRTSPEVAKKLFDYLALKNQKGIVQKVNPKYYDPECAEGYVKSFCEDSRQWPVKRKKIQVKIRVIDSRPYEEQLMVERKCQEQSRKYYAFKQKCLNQDSNEGLFGCHKEYYSAMQTKPRNPASAKKVLN